MASDDQVKVSDCRLQVNTNNMLYTACAVPQMTELSLYLYYLHNRVDFTICKVSPCPVALGMTTPLTRLRANFRRRRCEQNVNLLISILLFLFSLLHDVHKMRLVYSS